jgi:hypothetical protein
MGFTVQDLMPEITSSDGLATCDQQQVFSGLTDVLRLLGQKAHFDFALGVIDIAVCNSCVTLPHFVGGVLAINTCGLPTFLRDQWYQFHINGVGSVKWTDCGMGDVLDTAVCTFRELSAPSRLVAVVENNSDNNKKVRVFGSDVNGKAIWTMGANGQMQEGYLVPTIAGFPISTVNPPLFARIDRIELETPRQGFIRLVGIDPANPNEATNKVLLGYYDPTEKYPSYNRIRVARANSWVRIKYRKAYENIRSVTDWVNCDNRLAIKLGCQAIALYKQRRYDEAQAAEANAVRMLSDDQNIKTVPTSVGPQIVTNVYSNFDSLYNDGFYGPYGSY